MKSYIIFEVNEFEIKIPEDILKFMKENIEYGWIDIN